jgi:hypothetical protein
VSQEIHAPALKGFGQTLKGCQVFFKALVTTYGIHYTELTQNMVNLLMHAHAFEDFFELIQILRKYSQFASRAWFEPSDLV